MPCCLSSRFPFQQCSLGRLDFGGLHFIEPEPESSAIHSLFDRRRLLESNPRIEPEPVSRPSSIVDYSLEVLLTLNQFLSPCCLNILYSSQLRDRQRISSEQSQDRTGTSVQSFFDRRLLLEVSMAKNSTHVHVQGHGLGQGGGKDAKFAASIIVGTLVVFASLLGVAVLLHRLYRFFKLEKALRALKIPPARFQPEGAINTVCTICIADFRPRVRVAVLPTCGHVFHRHCLREVVAGQSPRCPLCCAALL